MSPVADPHVGKTTRRLLSAGVEILRETSFSGLSVRTVALRAGVSPAGAYKHFSSKNALVAAIYLDLIRDFPRRTDVNESPKTRMKSTLRDMALAGANEPNLSRAWAAALMADDPAVQPIRAAIAAAELAGRIAAALGPGFAPSGPLNPAHDAYRSVDDRAILDRRYDESSR